MKTNLPCVATGESREGFVCLHHLYTKKARPDLKYESWNLIPVDQATHNAFHSLGISEMAKRNPSVKKWLEDNDWYYCTIAKKWVHPGAMFG